MRYRFHGDESQRTTIVSPALSDKVFSPHRELVPSEGWFRLEDLVQFSKPWLIFQAILGGLIGYAASALILIFAVVSYGALIPLFVPGVLASTVFLAFVGLQRNRLVRFIAARGFGTAFHFRTASSGFYLVSVLSGLIGLGYGYGYVSRQSTALVLPFAGLFILFLYLYLLWSRIFKTTEEGRLCIFQFLVEHGENGRGYSWLKHGLSFTQSTLQRFGVSIKRNRLYFGTSYSLLEGSYLEWDLDNIHFLGDWTSRPSDLRAVHEIASWFLYRSKKAEKHGFSRVFSLLDYLSDPQVLQIIITALGVIVAMVIAILRP